MKKLLILSLITFSLSCFGKGPALGLILFGPTGVSGLYGLSQTEAIDAALYVSSKKKYLHSTYISQFNKKLIVDGVKINTYWGVGGRILIRDEGEDPLGVRGSLGLQKFLSNSIGTFAEVSTIVDVINENDVHFDIGLGARFYF